LKVIAALYYNSCDDAIHARALY